MIKPQTLKGFRDFLPQEARKRQYVIDKLKTVFEKYGFEPLETPTLEYEEIMSGKYGEEGEKLMYRFRDNGQRKVAMRYDQTVPLSRVVAQHSEKLPLIFKRYQIQNVWRADNTQKGRFREFLQCDIDCMGAYQPTADAEILACVNSCLERLGFKDFEIRINDRTTFLDLMTLIQGDLKAEKEIIKILASSIDKLEKIGKDNVIKELLSNDLLQKHLFAGSASNKLLSKFLDTKPYTLSEEPTLEALIPNPTRYLRSIIENAVELGVDEKRILITPTLARGLDYYTGMIFEVIIKDYSVGSIAGGGRYDGLVNMFFDRDIEPIPAVGMSFGFDRLIEAMDEKDLFKSTINTTTKVIVTTLSLSKDNKSSALKIVKKLRDSDINSEIFFLDELNSATTIRNDIEFTLKFKNRVKEKLYKYTEQKNIPFAIILNDEELGKEILTLRNLQTREQAQKPLDEIIKELGK